MRSCCRSATGLPHLQMNRSDVNVGNKKKYSSPSSKPALRHPLHSHKDNKTPLDNMSTDNVFNSMFTLQLAGSLSQGRSCALASKTVTSDKSGGRPFVLEAGGDGLQTAASGANASKFPPLNGIRNMSSHQFYHRAPSSAVPLTRPLATSWRRAAIDPQPTAASSEALGVSVRGPFVTVFTRRDKQVWQSHVLLILIKTSQLAIHD